MRPEEIQSKKILFTVLNWGLGHATRSSKLIRDLSIHNELVIASDGEALAWLRQEFPDHRSIEMDELNMTYAKRGGAVLGILFKLPHFVRHIQKDHREIKDLVQKEEIDLIISDNRYGCYQANIPSILITHQLNLMHPLTKFFQLPLQNYLDKFDAIWIPDYPDHSISGDLSKSTEELRPELIYVGNLSRYDSRIERKSEIKFLLIPSGPEPHKSLMTDYFIQEFKKAGVELNIAIQGLNLTEEDGIIIHHDLNSRELEGLILRSEWVIGRSGYTSIMDYLKLGQKAILIPTPHQYEQEYLANFHCNDPKFRVVLEKRDLKRIMSELIH